MTLWAWLSIAFVAGALLGAGVVWWLGRRRPNEVRLRRMQAALDRFQGEVAHHFQESAELITRLRNDVEQLYQHLEQGAAALTTEEAVQRRLRQLEDGDDTGRTTGSR
ncbi:MAG: DUF1043 family protein [Deinococcales bacterium]|nr:DUF1043 family protein [Deinococcales bacterium]